MHVVDLICFVLTAFEEVYCNLFDQRKCRQNTCTLVNQMLERPSADSQLLCLEIDQ